MVVKVVVEVEVVVVRILWSVEEVVVVEVVVN